MTMPPTTTMRRNVLLPVAGLIVTLALAGCGNGDDDAPPTPDGPDEMTSVTVGVMPIVDTAAIFLGEQEGIFAEHGLELDFEMAQGGAAIIPAMIGGDYDFGFSNLPSLLIAVSEGLPLTMLAAANTTTGDTESDFSAVVVPEDSDIQDPTDLAGRTVAVSTLNNIGDVTISHVVDTAGGDADSIQFVEIGFPDMPAALAAGQIEAAWILEPFLTIAKEDGARVISHNYAETDDDLLIAGYFTTEQYAQENPELVEAFTSAMRASQEYARDNPDAAREVLGEYTDIAPSVRDALVMPEFPTEIDIDAVQLLADLSLEYGLINNPVSAEDLVR